MKAHSPGRRYPCICSVRLQPDRVARPLEQTAWRDGFSQTGVARRL